MTQARAMSPFLIPGNVTIRETQKVTTVQQRLLKSPRLPCPSQPPVSPAAWCPRLAAPHLVSSSVLRAASSLRSSYQAPTCVCVQGLPLLTRVPCSRVTTTHACRGPVSKRGHALRRRRLAFWPSSG